MSPRFICPHCHSPVEPQRMDSLVSDQAACRICPECDEPIVLVTTLGLPIAAQGSAIDYPNNSPTPGGEIRL